MSSFTVSKRITRRQADSLAGATETNAYNNSVGDDKAEREKCYTAPLTRSRALNKTLLSTSNQLFVYPFLVEEEILQSVSSQLTELRGDCLGVAGATQSASELCDFDDGDEDGNKEEDQVKDTSTRSRYLTIYETDRAKLQPGQFLNDTLVDFWMSWYDYCCSLCFNPTQMTLTGHMCLLTYRKGFLETNLIEIRTMYISFHLIS